MSASRAGFWVACAGLVAGLMLGLTTQASAQFIPRHCGMRAGGESFGSLTVGSMVVLGQHTPWNGDANWAPEMQRFVGMTARIARFDGVDSAGCPGVRVDADGQQWFWRIRDMQVAGGMIGGGDAIPRQCDMRAGAEFYGSVMVGSTIVLGRHTPWRGDANWADEMNRFVGMTARVVRFDGVDSGGCPGVRVDVDGQQWFWRIRDAQLAGMGGGMVMGPPIPNWCGMTSGAETYGPIRVGSVVILGQHSPWQGDANWAAEMGRYVGMRAVVQELGGLDSAGCPGVRVDADGRQYFWRIRDMRM